MLKRRMFNKKEAKRMRMPRSSKKILRSNNQSRRSLSNSSKASDSWKRVTASIQFLKSDKISLLDDFKICHKVLKERVEESFMTTVSKMKKLVNFLGIYNSYDELDLINRQMYIY